VKYILGVDGGNTKTDYLLCTPEGDFVDVLRTGTCSHETFSNGYDGMQQAMQTQLNQLFERNNITAANIAAAGLGLAGADLPEQITELEKRVHNLGLSTFGVANDGILGIKGASHTGVGLCAVNGTGTVIIGADEKGEILQVGGVGPLSGDFAGGSYIRSQIIAALYDFYYRCGENSVMFTQLIALFDTKPADLLTLISDYNLLAKSTIEIIKIADDSARDGDKVAKNIFDTVGFEVGKSAAGCIKNLSFTQVGNHANPDNPLEIILVGSIWHKIIYSGMIATFLETVQKLSGKYCKAVTLKNPPAVGGVLWAKELLLKQENSAQQIPQEYREKLLETITLDFYDEHLKM